jgi:hypothetical protein
MRLSVWSRQQPEVTPVVPFKNKIQHYQLKQSFLITPYFVDNREIPILGLCTKYYRVFLKKCHLKVGVEEPTVNAPLVF